MLSNWFLISRLMLALGSNSSVLRLNSYVPLVRSLLCLSLSRSPKSLSSSLSRSSIVFLLPRGTSSLSSSIMRSSLRRFNLSTSSLSSPSWWYPGGSFHFPSKVFACEEKSEVFHNLPTEFIPIGLPLAGGVENSSR